MVIRERADPCRFVSTVSRSINDYQFTIKLTVVCGP